MPKVTLFLAVFAVLEACVAASLALNRSFDDLQSVFCVIGATVGSFVAIAIFPPANDTDENKTRRLSLKFGISILSAVTFAPLILVATGAPREADYLMAISAIVAVFVMTIMHVVLSRIKR